MKNKKLLTLFTVSMLAGITLASCNGNTPNESSLADKDSTSSLEPTTSNDSISSENPVTSEDSTTSNDSVSSEESSSSEEDENTSSDPIADIEVTITGESVVKLGSTITLVANVTGSTQGVTWSSENDEIATVNEDGVVTGVAEGEVKITATSKEDSTKSASIDITVEEVKLGVKLGVYDYAEGNTLQTSVVEGSGAYTLKVEIENMPSDLTMDDVDVTWAYNNAIHNIFDHDLLGSKMVKAVTFNGAGRDFIEVKVKVGEETFTQVLNFPVIRNDDLYKKITTAKQFVDLIEKTGTITDKFMLMNNIDLTGYVHEGNHKVTFNGTLDGNGYSVTGYTERPVGDSEGTGGVSGGLFTYVHGIIRNIHVEASLDAPIGWSGLLARELFADSFVQDVLVISDDITSSEEIDWTWQRNGVLAGMIKGYVSDSVSLEDPDGERNTRSLTTAAYGWYNENNGEARGILDNVYTNGNTNDNQTAYPFGPDSEWSSDDRIIDGHADWNYKTALASDYELDSSIWTLTDHAMPQLKHAGEKAVKLEPTVEISGSKNVKVGETIELTANPILVEENETITYEFESSNSQIASVTSEGAKATITGVAAGDADITVKMNYKGQVYTSDAFTITVDPEGHVGLAISSLDELKAYFTGGAENCNKDAYLTTDIDCEGWVMPGPGIAGEFNAKFDGAGCTISNFTVPFAMFNIIGSNGRIFDLNVKGTYTGEAAWGFVCYSNNGEIKNVDCDITLNANLGGVPNAPFGQAGSGSISDCHIDVRFVEGKVVSNYFAVAAGAGLTITNCDCTYYGLASSEGSTAPNPAPYNDFVTVTDGDAN